MRAFAEVGRHVAVHVGRQRIGTTFDLAGPRVIERTHFLGKGFLIGKFVLRRIGIGNLNVVCIQEIGAGRQLFKPLFHFSLETAYYTENFVVLGFSHPVGAENGDYLSLIHI